jgi:hypothetical protein
MKALSAALVLGLAALGVASSASADTRVRIYAGAPGPYYAQPAAVYYGEPRYDGGPDWRARRAWREDQLRREEWRRREAWRHEQWQREHWRREHWRREEWRRDHWRD